MREAPLDCHNPGLLARMRCRRLHGKAWSATVPLVISYRNGLRPLFRPHTLSYEVNGKTTFSWRRAYNAKTPPSIVAATRVSALRGRDAHTLHVTLEYRGHGHGPFRYLRLMRIHIHRSIELRATPGAAVCAIVDAFERTGRALRERLTVHLRQPSARECQRLADATP